DRDLAPQTRIARAIALAHPSRAKRGDDLVSAKTGAGDQGHWGNLPHAQMCRLDRHAPDSSLSLPSHPSAREALTGPRPRFTLNRDQQSRSRTVVECKLSSPPLDPMPLMSLI